MRHVAGDKVAFRGAGKVKATLSVSKKRYKFLIFLDIRSNLKSVLAVAPQNFCSVSASTRRTKQPGVGKQIIGGQ